MEDIAASTDAAIVEDEEAPNGTVATPKIEEQRMNAVLPCEGLKVGVRPRVSENGLVEREEIVKVIKSE